MKPREAWSQREIERLCEYMVSGMYDEAEIAWLMNRPLDAVCAVWRMVTTAMGA